MRAAVMTSWKRDQAALWRICYQLITEYGYTPPMRIEAAALRDMNN
jgi:hypothetical protein